MKTRREIVYIILGCALLFWVLDAGLHWLLYGEETSFQLFLVPRFLSGLIRTATLIVIVFTILYIHTKSEVIKEAQQGKIKTEINLVKALHAQKGLKDINDELEWEIAERRRIEGDLRKLSLAFEQNPCSVLITNVNGSIEYVNPRFEDLTGYTKKEVLGKKPNLLKSGQTPQETYDDLWVHLNQGFPWHGEFINKKKSGEIYWEAATISPVKNEDGAVTHFVAVLEDITARKKAEEENQKHQAGLELLNKELELSNKELKNFASVAAHDIKSPLAKIDTAADLLKKNLGGKLSESDIKLIDLMTRTTKRMNQLITSLYQYSKIEHEEIEKKKIDLNQVIHELIRIELSQALEETQAKIEIPQTISNVVGDEVQIRELMQNLISNALKYRKKDIIPDVQIHARVESNMIRVEVRDNGIGIKPEDRQRIFQMFGRVSQGTKIQGLGVGLAVAQKIIDRHGGSIGVDSEFGKGTIFWFTLPKAS